MKYEGGGCGVGYAQLLEGLGGRTRGLVGGDARCLLVQVRTRRLLAWLLTQDRHRTRQAGISERIEASMQLGYERRQCTVRWRALEFLGSALR